ncbi:MAG TPA: cytochrome c [Chitinophagaceae bacterium]
MAKVAILITLCILYSGYSVLVYTKGTHNRYSFSNSEQELISEGKRIYQEYNCMSCHQVYGLGGYLGTDLTTAYSDKRRGEAYMRALLQSGGSRMPDFKFKPKQIDAIIAYLKYVDTTATPIKF